MLYSDGTNPKGGQMETLNDLIEKAKKILKKDKSSNTVDIVIDGQTIVVVERDLKGNISVTYK